MTAPVEFFISYQSMQGAEPVMIDPDTYPLVASHPDRLNLIASFLSANMEQLETYLEEGEE